MTERPVVVALDCPDPVVGYLAVGGAQVDAVPLVSVADTPDAQVAELLRARHGAALVGVVAVSDAVVARAASLNEALATPGATAAAVRVAADKGAMRERLEGTGIGTVRWRPVITVSDVVELLTLIDGPVVLKPRGGSASRNVVRVDRADERALESLREMLAQEPHWIVEEFVQGREVSVETLSWGGHHRVLAITDKEVGDAFIETGHKMPSDLSDHEYDELTSATRRVLAAVGIDNTIGHTEFILTERGPIVVETHPRMGGDRIGRLVELVTGQHPMTALSAALCSTDPDTGATVGGASIAFLTASAGIVESVSGVDVATGSAGVDEVDLTLTTGSVVAPLRSSTDRCGHVLAVGATAGMAADRARRAADQIRITTRAGEPTLA